MKKAIVWFRNDLRLHDNEALFEALSWADEILPIYVFDPRQYVNLAYGFPKTGRHRLRFQQESVRDLRMNLQDLGADLIVRTGHPEDVLFSLARYHEIFSIFCHEENCFEERAVEDQLIANMQTLDGEVNFHWGLSLLHYDDLPFDLDHVPEQFTTFRKAVEKDLPIRLSYPRPEKITIVKGIEAGEIPKEDQLIRLPNELKEQTVDRDRALGGETHGLIRVKNYIWESRLISRYKETRNGLLGSDYSSRFSPWLANGCLSPRLVYEEVKKYEEEVESNPSTYWLIFELLWRDYFRFVSLKHGSAIFKEGGIRGKGIGGYEDAMSFHRWADGNTGVPFIDAAMRELLATGFTSNRARQNVASFFVKDMKMDWRMGAAWFESQLIDYDPASNYLNWNYIAGIGNDPREGRYFNVLKQAERYDPTGAFVKHWIPELRNLPSSRVHQPFLLNNVEQEYLKIRLGQEYPKPCINLKQWKALRKETK